MAEVKQTFNTTGQVLGLDPFNQNQETLAWRPARLRLNVDGEVLFAKLWPKSKQEPSTLPDWMANVDLDTFTGKYVKVKLSVDKDNFNKHTLYNLLIITPEVYWEGKGYPTTANGEAPEGEAPKPLPSMPPTRMEVGMAKGNAISAITALIAAYVSKTGKLPRLEFIQAAAGLINSGSEAIISGRLAVEEEKRIAEAGGLASVEDEDGSIPESFGSIDLGGHNDGPRIPVYLYDGPKAQTLGPSM